MTQQNDSATAKILALVDASLYARSVCENAAWIAGRTGAPIELLHVLGRREAPDKQDLSGSIALGARSTILSELAELDAQRSRLVAHRGRAILDDALALVKEAGVTSVSAQLRHGDLLETVAEKETGASMVVIGKRGEAADFAKGHLGSNLERVVRASSKPVFVAARAFRPVETILVAYDGGPSAIRAVEHLAASPLYRGLDATVVTVGNPSRSLEEGLADAAAMLRAAGVGARIEVVEGHPDAALGKLVEDRNFGLLVMGAYGHSRIRSLIIGSTTSEMVRSCKIPVVMVR